jgi:hypothetical protein
MISANRLILFGRGVNLNPFERERETHQLGGRGILVVFFLVFGFHAAFKEGKTCVLGIATFVKIRAHPCLKV